MSRELRRLLLVSASLALLPVPSRAADDAPLVDRIVGASFSGSDKDADGLRRWTLNADTATPKPAPAKNEWALERVRIRTFERTGRTAATIAAPTAQYEGETRTAHDTGPVSMDGDNLRLTGRDWKWVNVSGDTNTITVDSDVRVVITRPESAGERAVPIVITARKLLAEMRPGGTRLTFEGDVRVTQGETVTTCDNLVTRVRGSGNEVGKSPRESVERIDATGHVKLANRGAVITGGTATVVPAKALYSVFGDAVFTDLADKRIRVAGDAMHYDAVARRITVDPPAGSEDGRVTAEMPPIDTARAKDPAQSDLRARASGRKMEILITPETKTMLFTGDVRIADPDYTGSCDRLTVVTASRETEFVPTGPATGALRHVVAEGAVSLTRDGRTIRCDHADILPEKNLVTLTGSPVAEDPTQGVTLEGARMTLDTTDTLTRKLVATSSPERRVRVAFSPVRRKDPEKFAALPGVTTVESDTLVATQREETGVFEFGNHVKISGEKLSGTCDRMGVEVRRDREVKFAPRLRHIVAVGHVKLRQAAYAAESGRAEIYPHADLKELSVRDDNGMDGRDPCYVALSRDDSTPDARPTVTLTSSLRTPKLGEPGLAAADDAPTTKAATPTMITADFQELIQGGERLRAFARGSVVVTGDNLHGESANAELLAVKKPATPGANGTTGFATETLVARGDVKATLGERVATADTMEIFPTQSRLILTGKPSVTGWPSTPGVERKTLEWKQEPGPDGKPTTALHLRDEVARGMPQQIIRPRLVLPPESAPDLGRSLKNLDNGE